MMGGVMADGVALVDCGFTMDAGFMVDCDTIMNGVTLMDSGAMVTAL